MARKVALVFGISGQTGAYLAHLLLARGYVVFGASRDSELNSFSNLRRLGIKDQIGLRSVSLADFRSVLKLLREVEPVEVYNLAGQSSVALSFEHPVETFESVTLGTVNILECLRFHGHATRFFNATSSDCFGNTQGSADESSPFRPRSPYAMAKAAAFWAVASYRESYGMHACNGILSNHESPLRPSRFVTRKIVLAARRIAAGSHERVSLGNLKIERDWGWAPDYADAIWRILQHEAATDFVVGTGRTYSLETFVGLAFSSLGLDWREHVDIDPGLLRPSDIARVALDPSKIGRELSWRPHIVMPDLVNALMEAENRGNVGSAPWIDGPLKDFGTSTAYGT